ncbi:MAG: hypothetical protein HZB51_33825 [Chloroflexi bacterium]|nr:hypothetical protein [Chloroflexota bacterium]
MMDFENDFDKLEEVLVRAGKSLDLPVTPPLATRVRAELQTPSARRVFGLPRFVWTAAVAILVALALLLAFPETREALAQIFGLRTIQIIPVTPTATVSPLPTRPSETSTPTVIPTPSRFAQCCETTLADARAKSNFPIRLPPAPPPSRVFFQVIPNFGAPNPQQVILVFGEPNNPQFTLYQATNFLYQKVVSGGTVIEETNVNGERALWLVGAPHLLVYIDANGRPRPQSERTVNVNTLAWESGEVTYRLETTASKEEAIGFAESLR